MIQDGGTEGGAAAGGGGQEPAVTTEARRVEFAPIRLAPPGPRLGTIVFHPVRVDSVLIGDRPRLRWFCPGTNSLYSFVRSQQACQMGTVQVVARCRIRENRTRYMKPYQFAALKVQSRREWEATRARLAAGGGGDDIVLEKGLMLALKGHPFACELLEQWHDPDNIYTVLEFLNEGELISLVSKHPQSALDEDSARWLFVQALLGLKALHDLGYCHKDVSCENVLVHRPPATDASAAAVAKAAGLAGTGVEGGGGPVGAGTGPVEAAGGGTAGPGGTHPASPGASPTLLRRAKVIDFGAASPLRMRKVMREIPTGESPDGSPAPGGGGGGAGGGSPGSGPTVKVEVWDELPLPPPEVPFGKPAYMAPEYYGRDRRGYFGRRVDVWAMGIILYIMLEGEYLVDVPARTDAKFRQLQENRLGEILQGCQGRRQREGRPPMSREAANLLLGLLRTDPMRRPPDMDHVLRHRWCQPALPAAARALKAALDRIEASARHAVAVDRGLERPAPGAPPPPAGSPEALAREAVSKIPLVNLPLPPSAYLIARGLVACFDAAKRPATASVRALAARAPPAPGMVVAGSKPTAAGPPVVPPGGVGGGVSGGGGSATGGAAAMERARSEAGPAGVGLRAGGGPAVPGVGFDGRNLGMAESAVAHAQSMPAAGGGMGGSGGAAGASSSGVGAGGSQVGMDADDDDS